jgi:hypothetical protein
MTLILETWVSNEKVDRTSGEDERNMIYKRELTLKYAVIQLQVEMI